MPGTICHFKRLLTWGALNFKETTIRMSYPGSHEQFGLSDLQMLQQKLMLARLQELQKQQQLINASGMGASGMGASSNLNWMHQNVSTSTQGIIRGSTYSHGEGVMMNPSLQQHDMPLFGAPVTSRRDNLGQFTRMQEVSYSLNEKPISQMPELTNSFFGDKHSVSLSHAQSTGGSFMVRQGLQHQASVPMPNSGIASQVKSLQKVSSPPEYDRIGEQHGDNVFLVESTKQTNDSRGMATLDPLEEKILFYTEDSGWDTSFSKLAALDTTDFMDASSGKEYMSSYPCIQSGTWSALMQSAVAEASSSDIGIQEELSGLSFQNTESSTVKQRSNIVSNEKQSTSDTQSAPLSSVDSMKPQRSSRCPDGQQLPRAPEPAGLLVNDCDGPNDKHLRDIYQGSKSSALSVSWTIRNDCDFNQQAVDNRVFMPTSEDTIQKGYKSTSYDHQSNSNPMALDMLYKRAAEIYGNQNYYRAENSCDSYNSKLSQAYVAQAGHACLNAEDSESSARNSHKSQNQAVCMLSPGANSRQECFSHLKSDSEFPTNTNPVVKGKPNLLSDAFSKGSPASDMSTSFDSQYTTEHDKERELRDHGKTIQGYNVCQTESQEFNVPNVSVSQGVAIPDRFSFQSSVPWDSRLVSMGYEQKGQTWWTSSSIGQSFSSLQGASVPESCAGKSRVYGKTVVETSNLKGEDNSLEGFMSGLQHVNNLVDGKTISMSESVRKTFPEMSQQMSLPGLSPTQDAYQLKIGNSFDREYTSSGFLSVSQSAVVEDLPLFGLPSRSLAMKKDNSDEQKAPMIVNAAVVEDQESPETYLKISSDSSAFVGSINSGVGQRSFSGTTLRVLPTCSQPQVLHNVENPKKQLDIVYTDINKVDSNSISLYNLNKQWVPDIPGSQLVPGPGMHKPAKHPFGSQLESCSSGYNRSNLVEVSTQPSALQYMHSHKVPMLHGCSSDTNVFYDRTRHLQMKAQIAPAGYVQNGYIKNRQMFSLCGSAALASNKPYENAQLSGTTIHVNGADVSSNYEFLPGLANKTVTSEQSLPSSVPLSDDNVHLVFSRPKKRKITMHDCLPWYKKVMITRQGIPDISAAEEEWAEVSNRLMEKRMDEGERNEMQPVRAKRRLIVTAELTQLIFRPPPPSVLSVDARIEYEIMVYFITKLALADACGLANVTRTDFNMPRDIGNMSGGMANHLSDKATELLQRTNELKTHVERSGKGISVVDILIECQELEKFGIINHFAKYHSRVPESAGKDSASSSTGMISVRPFLRRYVSAIPLLGKLPEGVHCLSL